jgi:hypothetical protein
MPDDDQLNGIGEPTPVGEGEGWSVLARWASFATVIGGGVVAFAVMTTPTHVRGATTSSRLKWQQATHEATCEGAQEVQSGSLTNAAKTPGTSRARDAK